MGESGIEGWTSPQAASFNDLERGPRGPCQLLSSPCRHADVMAIGVDVESNWRSEGNQYRFKAASICFANSISLSVTPPIECVESIKVSRR